MMLALLPSLSPVWTKKKLMRALSSLKHCFGVKPISSVWKPSSELVSGNCLPVVSSYGMNPVVWFIELLIAINAIKGNASNQDILVCAQIFASLVLNWSLFHPGQALKCLWLAFEVALPLS